MATTPPAGWYDDPEHAGMLRYWDGNEWTTHRAPGSMSRPATASGLTNVADWLRATVRVARVRWRATAALVGVSMFGSALLGATLPALLGDVVYADGRWSSGAGAALVPAVAVVTIVALGLLWAHLALADQFYFAHLFEDRSLRASARAALTALPRLLAWVALGVAAFLVWSFLLVMLGTIGAGALAAALGLGSLVAMVWVAVRLSCVLPAAAVPVPERNLLQASADVSRRRFWPVVGRLAMLWIVTGLLSVVLSMVTSPIAFASSSIDRAEVDRQLVLADDDSLVFLDVGALADALGVSAFSFAVISISGAITGAVWVSGLCSLFAQTHRYPQRDGTP